MKIVADENILLLDYYFPDADIVLKPGRALVREDVIDADILLVRSVTKVGAALLHNTAVKFVGSTTAGIDHLDTAWLDQAGIVWTGAKGCNAIAVVEYIISIIAALQQENLLVQKNLRAAVVGVGEIGSLVAAVLKKLNFEVLLCDPWRSKEEKDFLGVTLNDIADVDFITLHTPLTHTGEFPTHHLIDKDFLTRQKPGCVLVNSSRGEVIQSTDLKQFGQHLIWCLDVFDNEPNIDLTILQKTHLATPHIAGYSLQSKYRGIEQVYRFAVDKKIITDNILPPSPLLNAGKKDFTHCLERFEKPWQEKVLAVFDPRITSKKMKELLLEEYSTFDQLRKKYIERVEYLSNDMFRFLSS